MFASVRSKKKCKDSPGGTGLVNAKIDQQQQQSRRRDAPEALKLPSPLKYYPGTQMPMDGWFHACRLCRCWTAFSATATTGELVPLCRRCLPSAARKGVQQAPKVVAQPIQQQTHSSASHGSAGVTATPTKQLSGKAPAPSAAPHRSANKMADAALKATHAWSNNSYSSIHQQHQQYHQQAVQQQPVQQQQQQQQRYSQRPQPGQAKTSFSYKAGSRVFKPSSSDESYIEPAQVAAAAAAATAALAPASVPAAVPTAQPTAHQLGYSRRTSNSSVPDRRSSTGDGQYAPCYKHLGPSNMHASAAPADTYITCLSNGGSDNGTDAERQQSGTDMLGAITSLLSDLYKMGFSGSSSAASSRPDSRQGGLISRSDSGSKTAPAAEALCNLPI